MLPMPAMIVWSIRNALSFIGWAQQQVAEDRPRHRLLDRVEAERRPARATSSVSSSGVVTNISPNVRGSTKRSWPPWVKVMTTWVCLSTGSLVAAPQELAAHAQVDHQHVAGVELEQQVLALALDAGDLGAVELGDELPSWSGAGSMRVPVTSTVLIRLPTTSRSSSRRMVSTSGSSGIGPARSRRRRSWIGRRSGGRARTETVGAVRAPSAVRCRHGGAGRGLLGLLLGPALALALAISSPSRTVGEEPLLVVGALVAQLVDGQLLELRGPPAPAAGSCSRGRRAPRRRPRSMRSASSSSTRRRPASSRRRGRRRRSRPPWRRRGSTASRRPPLASSPLPRRRTVAEAELARPTSASVAALTTDARTLASSPSGMSG